MKPNYQPIFIAGRKVSWSVWGWLLHKICKNDFDKAAHIMLRAHQEGVRNIMGWLRYGLGEGGYCWRMCGLEYENPRACQEWIDKNLARTADGGFNRIGDLLKNHREIELARAYAEIERLKAGKE